MPEKSLSLNRLKQSFLQLLLKNNRKIVAKKFGGYGENL
jgi:hypothetical protein